ncbi:hypothetical protein ACFL20_08135 [Spirochaetota bacterium]
MTEKKDQKFNPKLKLHLFNYKIDKLRHNTCNKTSVQQTNKFEVIKDYYSFLNAKKNNNEELNTKSCFAVRLTRFLLEYIKNSRIKLLSDCGFEEDFYKQCISELLDSDLLEEVKDENLMLIYMKQVMNMLRAGKLISDNKGYAVVSEENISNFSLFNRLLHCFWNEVRWEDIFPSDPEAAKELNWNRNVFKDIILKINCKIEFNKIANDFFELTGFGQKNDLFLISFLDFYLLTWLRHFGIIKYFNNSHDLPVCIELTNEGRTLLSQIG